MSGHGRPEGRQAWWPWPVATAGAILGVGGVIHAALTNPDVSVTSAIAQSFLVITFLGAGAILISRRPDHRISWLVPLPGLYLVLDEGLGLLVGLLALGERAELWLDWFTAVSFAYTFPPAAIFLPLLFPTGEPASPRWRWVLWTGSVSILCLTIGNAIAPDLLDPRTNPAAASEVLARAVLVPGALLLVVSFVAAGVSAITRYRASSGLERQQLRWFVRAAALVPLGWLAGIVTERTAYQQIGGLVLGVTLAMLPAAVTVAVLRYRLYDIDRVVSRTVSYAVVTVVLAGVYSGVVLAAQAVVGSRADVPDAVVAAATLLAAALFRPVRGHVQAAVDRRFARAGYDASATTAAFAAQLRDELAMRNVVTELADVVDRSLAPSSVSVWLAPEPAS